MIRMAPDKPKGSAARLIDFKLETNPGCQDLLVPYSRSMVIW